MSEEMTLEETPAIAAEPVPVPVETPEEKAAREAAEVEAKAEADRIAAEEEAKRIEAARLAKAESEKPRA